MRCVGKEDDPMMRDYGTGSVTDETLRVWPRSEPLGQLLIAERRWLKNGSGTPILRNDGFLLVLLYPGHQFR